MRADSATVFGPVILRQAGPRSGILDMWFAELRTQDDTCACLTRRLLPPYSEAAEYIRMLDTRVQEVRQLEHPAVILPAYWQRENTIPYLLLEAPTGWNCQTLLTECLERRVAIPTELALHLIFPCAHALAAAHARPESPLVHGAVRPVAIWLDMDGRPRLGDFEIGALAEFDLRGSDAFAQNGWRCMAPERTLNWAEPPATTDVYSLAAVLLELLCVGRLTEIQYQSALGDRLAMLMAQKLPVPLLKLLAACHADLPEERPSMATLAEQLKELARQLPRTQSLGNFLQSLLEPPPPFRTNANPGTFYTALQRLPPPALVPKPDASLAGAGTSRGGKKRQKSAGQAEGEPGNKAPSSHRGTLYTLMFLVLLGVGAAIAKHEGLLHLPASETVSLQVTSLPVGAQIRQTDGALLGFTPLTLSVQPGKEDRLELEAQLEGYLPQVQSQAVVPGAPLHFAFTLERDPNARPGAEPKSRRAGDTSGEARGDARPQNKSSTGILVVVTHPPSEVYIDGNAYGTSDETRRIKVSAGRHTIEVVEPTLKRSAQYEATVMAGGAEKLEYDFTVRRWRLGIVSGTADTVPSSAASDAAKATQVGDGEAHSGEASAPAEAPPSPPANTVSGAE